MSYLGALPVVLVATLLWFGGSTYWYVCETQELCDDEKRQSVINQENSYNDGDDDYTEADDESEADEPSENPTAVQYTGPDVTVYFAPGTNTFRDNQWQTDLQPMLDYLREEPESSVTISGYAALTSGLTQEQGLTLSRSRTQAIHDYMLTQGLEANRITQVARAFSEPAGDNSTLDGQALNRRTLITIDKLSY